MHRVEWIEGAVEDLRRLDKPVARRILSKISWFSEHFDNIVPEPLSGALAGYYKLRVGDWRVVYAVETNVITILAIGHRKEIYR